VKFYAIGIGARAGGTCSPGASRESGPERSPWFRWFFAEGSVQGAPIDELRLRAAALAAGSRLGLEVFGGDAILVAPDQPVLIDVNDWPSFARFRQEAATTIARHAHHLHARVPRGGLGGADAP
jgi:hypothetical protein